MHGLSLVNEILSVVLKEARGKRVLSIKIALAEDGHTTPQSLSETFHLASRGTPAEGAELQIEKTSDLETRLIELEVEEANV
jgi:Zn finger protein HypA/HybF involved in hydrogenase expression